MLLRLSRVLQAAGGSASRGTTAMVLDAARVLPASWPAAVQRRSAATNGVSEKSPLKIFWGSQTGNAQGFAEELGMEAMGLDIPHEVIDLKKFQPSDLAPGTTVAFLAACYGMGEPTDNARDFYEWITSTNTTLAGVDFAVFGLGNARTHQERFNVVGITVDRRLEELGANRILARVDGDDSDCIECQFDEWQSDLLSTIKDFRAPESEAAATPSQSPESKTPSSSSATATAPSANYNVTVTPMNSRRELSSSPSFFADVLRPHVYQSQTALLPITKKTNLSPDSDRCTQEMLLSLLPDPRGGVAAKQSYRTGDHLVAYPQNQSSVVEEWLALVAGPAGDGLADADELLTVTKTSPQGRVSVPVDISMTAREMFTFCMELQSIPSPKALRSLAGCCSDEAHAKAILALAGTETYRESVQGKSRTILDLAAEYPSMHLSLEFAITHLPVLQPRYYSISSCSEMHPDDVSITYRVLEYTSPLGKARKGVCTTFLQSLEKSELLPAYIWESDFKLPADVGTPVLMFAGGTGIAPFKAFMEENMASYAAGSTLRPSALFYGIRDPTEFVYEAAIKAAESAGALALVNISYSMAAPEGVETKFLSDSIIEQGAYIFKQLERNAHVYLCGGASGFGPSVIQALKQVIANEGNMSAADADKYFSAMMRDKRVLEDLSD